MVFLLDLYEGEKWEKFVGDKRERMREIKGRVLSVSPAVAGGVFLKKGGGTREAVRLGGRQGELLPCLSFRHPLCRRQLCG